MVGNQFGTGTSASTMVSGRCELQTGPQMKYRLDSNDEVGWIEMQGGDEPFRFEPPLELHAPTFHSNQALFEERFEQWLGMMMDCRCDFYFAEEEVHTPVLDFEVITMAVEGSIREPDIYWEDVRYDFPTVVDEDDTADTLTESDFPHPSEMYIDSPRDSLLEFFDFWKSEWGEVYQDYEKGAVVVEADGAPPTAVETIENYDFPEPIMVDVVGWIAEGGGYCDAEWCPVGTPQEEFCAEHRRYDAHDTVGVDVARGGEESDTDTKSLEDKLNEVADEIGQKRVEEMDERAVEYMRENRDDFKAEIVDASYSGHGTVDLKLDIPTLDGHSTHHLQLPDSDGEYSGDGRTRDVMNYLGVTLRELHMIEGMYLPVTFGGAEGSRWDVQLPSDEKTSGMWSSFASPETLVSVGCIMAGITTVVGLFYSIEVMMTSCFLWMITFYGVWKTFQRDMEP